MTSTAAPEAPAPGTLDALRETVAPGGRAYTDPVSEKRYPSVTTILNATQSKFGIGDWQARLAAEFAVDHPQAWQAVEQAAGRQAAVDLIRKASDRERDAKGERGSFVHSVVEALVLDQPLPTVEGEVEAAMLDHFLTWVTDYDADFWMAEITVANRTLGYAGTLDGGATLGRCSGLRVLLDVKTGNRVYPQEAAAQLTAYRNCEEVWLPQGGKDAMPDVDAVATLHLTADGYDFLRLTDAEIAWEDWCNRVRAYYSGRQMAGRRAVVGRIRRDDDPHFVMDLPSLAKCRGPLEAVGLTTLEQVAQFTGPDLLRIDGVGPKSVEALNAAITAAGLGA